MEKEFSEAKQAQITILVDNRADLIVRSTEAVKYFTKKPLLAEHGFAALIDLPEEGIHFLWDAGVTSLALVENMKRMEMDPQVIQKIVLSHGHEDHTAGVTELLRWMDRKPKPKEWNAEVNLQEIGKWAEIRRLPVIAHPAVFRERWYVGKDGKRYGPDLPPPRAEWDALGAEVILSEIPYELGAGCWTTGTIPRLSFEKTGRPPSHFYREQGMFFHDDIEDDQALVMHVKDKGLVILSGCAHSGIINTINYARQISGVERIWAVLGGFHLARAKQDELQMTVEALKEFKPELVIPSHCTGFQAQCVLAAQMPDAFLAGVVGATYLF